MRSLLVAAMVLGATLTALSARATSVEPVSLLEGVTHLDVQISIGSFPDPSNEILENERWLFGRSKSKIGEFKALILSEISAALSEQSIESAPGVDVRLLVEIWGNRASERLNVHLIELTLVKPSTTESGECYDTCDCSISESARALSFSSDEDLQKSLISQTLELLKSRWLDGISQETNACEH